jgi:ubiquinone biosynthesis accessory factor UbiJ
MLTERIQAAIDRNVAGSPRARELLASLEGRSLVIDVRYTPWRARLDAQQGRLVLKQTRDDKADALITGTPLAMLAMLREPPADVIRRGDVTLAGNSDVAQEFQELALLLRPDLEESLAEMIGDVPAHGLGQLLRKALDYSRNSARTVGLNIGEYLAHEKRTLVPRAEAGEFLAGVDALRESTDRIAARIQALETTPANQAPESAGRAS